MSQVVPVEIGDLGGLQRGLPWGTQIHTDRFDGVSRRREDPIVLEASYFGAVLQNGESLANERQCTSLPVLGLVQRNDPATEIDLAPTQGHHFRLTRSGCQAHYDSE